MIPWKFRFLAALIYLIGGTPATSFLASLALEIYYFDNKNTLSTSLSNYIDCNNISNQRKSL
jgi:hypothetical protein